jgi:predicted nucleic acid-binding Zn ribbon protein
MKVYDYQCPACGAVRENVLVEDMDEEVPCECGTAMTRLMATPHMLEKIIPTYPGSERRKAGYAHKYVNRPATKTQVGVGGGVTKGDD